MWLKQTITEDQERILMVMCQLNTRWFSDNAPQFFLYDFYGEQLKKVTYSYTGVSPLNPVILSRNPNRDIDRVSLPEYQQTIFDEIEYTLSYVDDEDIISK
jgi:hypothetical protein